MLLGANQASVRGLHSGINHSSSLAFVLIYRGIESDGWLVGRQMRKGALNGWKKSASMLERMFGSHRGPLTGGGTQTMIGAGCCGTDGGLTGMEIGKGQFGRRRIKAKAEAKKNDADQQQSPSPVNKWELLRQKPDEYEWDYDNQCYMPVTRLAEQLVVDWDNWNWNGNHTAREWNTRKKNIAAYKRREFPISQEEQATHIFVMYKKTNDLPYTCKLFSG